MKFFKRKPKLAIKVFYAGRHGSTKGKQLEVKEVISSTTIYEIRLDNWQTVRVEVTQS